MERSVPGILFFAASLAINSAVFVGADRAFYAGPQKMSAHKRAPSRENKDSMRFEFVEAPPVAAPEPVVEAQKISDRDARAQDLDGDRSQADNRPRVDALGPSDQLAQVRQTGAPPSPPAEASRPAPERPRSAASQTDSATAQEPSEKGVAATELMQAPPPAPEPSVAQQASEASPASDPRQPSQGLTGRDRITTQLMAKTSSRGASFEGVTSFEATGSGMGEYMKNLKERIWLAWFPYLAFNYPADFKTADVVLSLTLDENGNVKIVEVVDSEGSPTFATYCVEAVQRASGFGKVPEEILALIGKRELTFKFAFHYR